MCRNAEICILHTNGGTDVSYGSSHGDEAWHRMADMRAVGVF